MARKINRRAIRRPQPVREAQEVRPRLTDVDIDRLRLRGLTVVERSGFVDVKARDGRFIGRFQRVAPPQVVVGPDNVSSVAESDKVHKRRPGHRVTPSDVSVLEESRLVNRPK